MRRSRWPNLSPDELVDRCSAWAAEHDVDVVVVFDGGDTSERRVDDRCVVLGSGAASADALLEARAEELAAGGQPHWLVTSDRALRAAAGDAAERTVGGGAFLRELGAA